MRRLWPLISVIDNILHHRQAIDHVKLIELCRVDVDMFVMRQTVSMRGQSDSALCLSKQAQENLFKCRYTIK